MHSGWRNANLISLAEIKERGKQRLPWRSPLPSSTPAAIAARSHSGEGSARKRTSCATEDAEDSA